MGTLIATSGVVSYLSNPATGRIVIASLMAFTVSMCADAFVYQKLIKKKRFIKINGSNLASSLTDSIIFPVVAFGGFPLLIILGQFGAKVGGGFLWSLWLKDMEEES